MKAEAGQSISVKFTVVTDPYWGEVREHTLMKEGSESVTTTYSIKESEIVFQSLRVEDSGTYIIRGGNEAGVGSASFVLDITPARGK